MLQFLLLVFQLQLLEDQKPLQLVRILQLLQHLADCLQANAHLPQQLDAGNLAQLLRAVIPVTVFRPHLIGNQQANLVVVAQRADADLG